MIYLIINGSAVSRRNKLNIVIERIYPFDEVPQAIQKLKDGKVMGKVVIKVLSENNNVI